MNFFSRYHWFFFITSTEELDGWFFSRITQELLNRLPRNLVGGWGSAQNKPFQLLVRNWPKGMDPGPPWRWWWWLLSWGNSAWISMTEVWHIKVACGWAVGVLIIFRGDGLVSFYDSQQWWFHDDFRANGRTGGLCQIRDQWFRQSRLTHSIKHPSVAAPSG